MTRQVCLLGVLAATMATACGGSLKTGTISRPDASAPEEPTCPNDYVLCGTGPSAICIDLRSDPEHCGSCERACSPGVTCASGVCQRVLCQGQPLLSDTPSIAAPSVEAVPYGAVLADVNGDRILDLVFWPALRASKGGKGSFAISLGRPEGGFAAPADYTTDSLVRRVQIADVNHDGADDIFVLGPPCRELWLGHSDGVPTPNPTTLADDCDWAMTVADVSGDGHFDMVAGSAGGEINVYLSDSTGTLQSPRTYAGSLFLISNILVRDWNGDGTPDLVVVGGSLQVLYGRGGGIFDDAVACVVSVDSEIVVSDFNHDGTMDLATARSYGVDVMFGLGGCRFSPAAGYGVTGGCQMLEAADMDGDGQLDLLCVSYQDEIVALPGDGTTSWNRVLTGLLGNPDGSFQAAAPVKLGRSQGFAMAVGDATGDQRPDLVIAGGNGPVRVWENTCR